MTYTNKHIQLLNLTSTTGYPWRVAAVTINQHQTAVLSVELLRSKARGVQHIVLPRRHQNYLGNQPHWICSHWATSTIIAVTNKAASQKSKEPKELAEKQWTPGVLISFELAWLEKTP